MRVPVAADWKPVREPREHMNYDFNWGAWRQTRGEAEQNHFIAKTVHDFIERKKSHMAPGDIIQIGEFPLFFYFYIAPTGVVKELPMNDDNEPMYIPKELMQPFYKNRETSPRLYREAVFFYINILLHHNEHIPIGKEYVIHQYHRAAQTIDHYDLPPPNHHRVVIHRNVPITGDVARHLATGSIHSPGSSGGSRGARKARQPRKKKSNT